MKFFDAVELMKQGVICLCDNDQYRMIKITEEHGDSVLATYWQMQEWFEDEESWGVCPYIDTNDLINSEWKELDE